MNEIHPSAQIAPSVELGEGNYIGQFAVLTGDTKIGNNNWFGPHVVIGTPAEHKSRNPRDLSGRVEIGSQNVIREHSTIQAGMEKLTLVADGVWVQDMTHIGHDCTIQDEVTLACGVILGGHTVVMAHANLGLSSVVHQRTVIGQGAMVGMGAVVHRHVPPFATVIGNPARVTSVNEVGLARRGWTADDVESVRQVLKSGVIHDGLPNQLSTAFEIFRAATNPQS